MVGEIAEIGNLLMDEGIEGIEGIEALVSHSAAKVFLLTTFLYVVIFARAEGVRYCRMDSTPSSRPRRPMSPQNFRSPSALQ